MHISSVFLRHRIKLGWIFSMVPIVPLTTPPATSIFLVITTRAPHFSFKTFHGTPFILFITYSKEHQNNHYQKHGIQLILTVMWTITSFITSLYSCFEHSTVAFSVIVHPGSKGWPVLHTRLDSTSKFSLLWLPIRIQFNNSAYTISSDCLQFSLSNTIWKCFYKGLWNTCGLSISQ